MMTCRLQNIFEVKLLIRELINNNYVLPTGLEYIIGLQYLECILSHFTDCIKYVSGVQL